ncbi:MAG: hypothetical protein WAT66_04440, partial [Actinomycetota bacterium]
PKNWTRDERLALVSDILGRDIGSYNDLTDAEGRYVADVLEARGDVAADPMDTMEAEAEFDPFSLPDRPGVHYSAEAEQIMQSSAGGTREGASDGSLLDRSSAPAEQGSGPVGESESSPRLSSGPEQEKLPIRAATRLEQHQAAAAKTRARFADPRPPSLSGTPVAGSGGVGEHPAPPRILGREGEGDASTSKKGKGSEDLGSPLPSGAIEREPSDPLHHLAPDARMALIAHCKDDIDLARSLVGGYLTSKGLKNLDDERDAAHFARITFARGS